MEIKGCELCSNRATMHCESDQASLCWECDEKVHCANFLVAKHSRSLLCKVCQSPTAWKASGSKLGRTVSVCESCMHGQRGNRVEGEEIVSGARQRRHRPEDEAEGENGVDDDFSDSDSDSCRDSSDDSEDDDIEDDDDDENQVVPWSFTSSASSPPRPSSSSSSGEMSSSFAGNRNDLVFPSPSMKRFRPNSDDEDDEDEDDDCSSELNRKNSIAAASGSFLFRPSKQSRT